MLLPRVHLSGLMCERASFNVLGVRMKVRNRFKRSVAKSARAFKACLMGTILLSMLTCATQGFAAEFPERAINVIVPFTPGGSSDVIARLLANQLSKQWNQSIVVQNKPGAGATIGTAYVAEAPADGYTALLADTAQTTAPAMYKKLSYDAVEGFSAVGMVGTAPLVLLTSPGSGLRTVTDLNKTHRSRPGALTIGAGSGTASHLASELFQMRSSIKLQVIFYKGASQAIADLMASHIDLLFTNPASAAQYLNNGTLHAIGVTGSQREASFRTVPTLQEQGIEGMDVSYWFAMLLPVGVPEPVLKSWHEQLTRALQEPTVAQQLIKLGVTQSLLGPTQTQQFLRQDRAIWKKIIETAGIQPE